MAPQHRLSSSPSLSIYPPGLSSEQISFQLGNNMPVPSLGGRKPLGFMLFPEATEELGTIRDNAIILVSKLIIT